MALDKTGKLYIFELKRWEAKSENLLQVLRYGQIFGQYSCEKIEKIYQKFINSKKSLIDDHQDYFGLSNNEKLDPQQMNHSQHFLVVTDGTDLKTREAINYWKKVGIEIDSIVYRVYITENKEHLIEFNTYSPYQDVIEYEESSYILNTNFKNNEEQAHNEMLAQAKASAYYDPWKYKINRIQKGDRVFLYQSGVGIVGMGIGSGEVKVCDYEGNIDEEFSTPLNEFIKLKNPLTASKMKEITNSNIVFNQTMFSIDKTKGDIIRQFIIDNCL